MDSAPAPESISSEIERHPARDALIARVREIALHAAAQRDVAALAHPPSATSGEALEGDSASTKFGNPLEVLARDRVSPAEASLVAVVLALGVAVDFPSAPESELERAKELCFLAAHTPFNALLVADAVLGDERTRAFWRAVASLADPSSQDAKERPIALAALSAVAVSTSAAGRAAATELAARSEDPLVRALLRREGGRSSARLSGELSPAPHGPIATLLLACTGILFLMRGARLVGHIGLALKQPAELSLSERGLEVSHRTQVLGRVLRSKETLIPLGNLARVTREVRYPRLGLYLGLIALCVGSYLGMGLLVDGARVPGGSLPLLGMGLLVVALGLVIDYGLTALTDNVRGRCRIVVRLRKGKSVCVGALDPASADAMVSSLAQLAKS